MASPQVELGHTRLANSILEALVRHSWTSSIQLRLALHVVRQSYGFNRKMARPASLTELAMALSEPRSSVHRALRALIDGKVLVRDESGRLQLQKDYELWHAPVPSMGQHKAATVPPVGQMAVEASPSETVPPMGQRATKAPPSETVPPMGQRATKAPPSETVPPMGQQPGAPAVPWVGQTVPPVGQLLSKGIERQLERQNRNNIAGGAGELPLQGGDPLEGFSAWYADYPEKKARGAAEKAWRALKPAPALREQMVAAVSAQKQYRAAAAARREFVPRWPYPATWINGRRWLDVLTPSAASPTPSSGAPKAPAGKYANIGERHEVA